MSQQFMTQLMRLETKRNKRKWQFLALNEIKQQEMLINSWQFDVWGKVLSKFFQAKFTFSSFSRKLNLK